MRLALALGVVVATAATVTLGACGSSDGAGPGSVDGGTVPEGGGVPDGANPQDAGPCPSSGTGSVTVTVTGLPGTAAAMIDVQGAPVVKATATIMLGGGVHSVAAATVTSSDPIVRGVYTPTLSATSVCVKSGGTASVTVTYQKVPASHSLWVTQGNATGQVASIAGDALGATGTTTGAAFDVGVPSAADVIFDRAGGVWVASGGNGEVRHIPASQLGTAGTKTSDITLTSADFQAGIPGPSSLALDRTGNLWISLVAQKKVVKIPAGGAAAGNATPSVVLAGDIFDGVGAIEFDKSGNLFVATNDRLFRFDAAHLAASANPALPDLSLETMSLPPLVNTLTTASGIAFDATGNLWIAYFSGNIIARLTPAELALTGDKTGANALTPVIQLQTPVGNLEEIAFDESGGLWFSGGNGELERFAATQLTAAGTPTPATVITATGVGDTKGLAFFPAPAALPLYSALP